MKATSIPLLTRTEESDHDRIEGHDLESNPEGDEASWSHREHFSTVAPITEEYYQNEVRWTLRSSCQRLIHSLKALLEGRPRVSSHGLEGDTQPDLHSLHHKQKDGRRPRLLPGTLLCLAVALMMLGICQLLTLATGAFVAFFPDDIDRVIDTWGEAGQRSEGLSHWPTDLTGDIRPVACHSHNDYWRRVPLYSAIKAGCIGVEADIWLFEEELYVGHSTYALTPNRTLRNLYIYPLLDILEKQNPVTHFHPNPEVPPNGVFDGEPSQTLVLLIDFKTAGPPLWPFLYSQLEPLRQKGYLTHFNGTDVVEGPLTVVATGNAPFDLLMVNNTYRDVFFDAPLGEMAEKGFELQEPDSDIIPSADPAEPRESLAETDPFRCSLWCANDQGQEKSGGAPKNRDVYGPSNSYYASVSFKKSIGHVWRSRLTSKQLQLVREQIQGAHRRGLKVRYWDLPSWPRGLRNHLWHVLVREGVDILNVDDLVGATRRDWRRRKGWWY